MSWKTLIAALKGLFDMNAAPSPIKNQKSKIENSSLPRRQSLAQPCMICEQPTCINCPVYVTVCAAPCPLMVRAMPADRCPSHPKCGGPEFCHRCEHLQEAMNDVTDGGPTDPAQHSSSHEA